jgi:hypothetical protein
LDRRLILGGSDVSAFLCADKASSWDRSPRRCGRAVSCVCVCVRVRACVRVFVCILGAGVGECVGGWGRQLVACKQ